MAMKYFVLSSILTIFFSVGICFSQTQTDSPPDSVVKAREMLKKGQFTKAQEMLEESLKNASEQQKEQIRWEIERIRRIKLDYGDTEKEILNQCERRIKNFKPEELEKWEKQGKFDVRLIDGKKRYFNASVSNLAKRYRDIRVRFNNYSEEDNWGKKVLKMAKTIKKARKNSKSMYVTPVRLGAKHTIYPKDEYYSPGEEVRVWMPFPRETDYQRNIEIINATPEPSNIDDPKSIIRSVYFEQTSPEKEPPTFTLHYEFTRYGICPEVDPEKVTEYKNMDIYTKFTSEEKPNIVFTPEIAELTKKIIGEETNPYLKGKIIYNWISEYIVYSYAREYSTLLNIPEYVLENRYGDCGQLGLLFITMCRSAGVPAAWQSGWECMGKESWGLHDWTSIYIEPYGWIPVDPFMGVWAEHESTLPDEDREIIKEFYYGNMDPWRLEANAANNAQLKPEKIDFRSETVDFQRGEIEAGGENLFFGQLRRNMKVPK